MSTSIPTGDGDMNVAPLPPVSVPLLADEEALHRVFLAEYPALAEAARAQLADAQALVPKVVEGAFVRAWDARAELTTATQLHDFLADDVHRAAARALSRRAAAHRLGTHVEAHAARGAHEIHGEIDPAESWSHVMSAIQPEGHSQQVLERAAQVSRHGAAEHVAAIGKGRSWWIPVGVAAVIAIAAFGLVRWLDTVGVDDQMARAVNSPEARSVASDTRMANVTLDDGSQVRLAPDSKLSIAKEFGPKLRAVKVDGAANFKVAQGQPGDFRIFAGRALAIAKGTELVVRSYGSEDAATIFVREGSVEVKVPKTDNAPQTIAAGQAVVVASDGSTHAASPDEVAEAVSWTTNQLTVANRPLREVLPELKRWYGVDIHVQQPALLARPVSFRASLDSSTQAIKGVERSTGLEFGYVGQNMVFREPTAKPAVQQAGKAAKGSAKSKRRR